MFEEVTLQLLKEVYIGRTIELIEGIGLINIVLEDILGDLTKDVNKLLMGKEYETVQLYLKADYAELNI